MNKHLTILSMGLLFWLSPVYGEWIESSGQAQIINGNINLARQQAVDQATHYAMLKTGMSYTSHQQVTNGQLTADQYDVHQAASTGEVELISERIEGNQLTVQLRVDIFSDPALQCMGANTKVAVLIPQTEVKERSQLRYGQLENFGQNISEHLSQSINQTSRSALAHDHSQDRLEMNSNLHDTMGYRLPSWYSETTDSQYVLTSEITDISTEKSESSFLNFWAEPPIRQFGLTLSLYHGISGERIWRKNYHSQAPWEYERQQKVATNTRNFWQSKYGTRVDNILNSAIKDLDNLLSCRPVMAQVVARQADRIIINLGRQNGVQVGDKFQIILQKNLPDRLSKLRPLASESNAEVIIDQISEMTATAVLKNQNASYNIQISDIALKI